MTIFQAAEVLGISASTLRKYVSAGRLKTEKYGKAHHIEPWRLKQFFRDDWAKGESWEAFLKSRKGEVPADLLSIL